MASAQCRAAPEACTRPTGYLPMDHLQTDRLENRIDPRLPC